MYWNALIHHHDHSKFVQRPKSSKNSNFDTKMESVSMEVMANLKHECIRLMALILIKTLYITCMQAITKGFTTERLQKRPYNFKKFQEKLKTCSCILGHFKAICPSKHIAGGTRSDLQSNLSIEAQGIKKYHLTVCTSNSKSYLLIHTHLTCFCDWFALLEVIQSSWNELIEP